MINKNKEVTAVILAGGLARRMNRQDKGLVLYHHKPLVSYAITAMQHITQNIVINANRNQQQYRQFGYEVVSDQTDSFDGPLAGIYSVMCHVNTEILLVIPCDSPLIRAEHLNQLLNALDPQTDIAIAFDGQRLQPVFLALKTSLKNSLNTYLQTGQRKIDVWLQQQAFTQVDFRHQADIFLNINTLEELNHLENKPEMTQAGLAFSKSVIGIDEKGQQRNIQLVGERALTIYVDKQEIVTLMSMGTHPELLTLGYLKNQGFFDAINDIKVVQVDWQTEAVAVVTQQQHSDFSVQMQQRTVTTGCGQGTVFGRLMDKLKNIQVPHLQVKQSTLYHLLNALKAHNEVYKKAGAVHGCALCTGDKIDFFVEDVGRHNAVDTIAGYMWLNNLSGKQCIFYTTGRLTSEMVIKIAQMGIPILLSRSGATQMGLDMAKQAGVTLISRAKGQHFMILNGAENIQFDS